MKGKCERCCRTAVLGIGLLLLPLVGWCQVAEGIHSMHAVLDKLYDDMIPKCSKLVGIGQALAGFAALWYIAARVWGHIARAEPVDFYPLLRPFAIGIAILFFPGVIEIANGVLETTVTGTSQLVENTNKSVDELLKKKQEEIKKTKEWEALVGPEGEGDRDVWMKYYHKDEVGDEGFFGSIGNDIQFALAKATYNFKNSVKKVVAIILQIIYEAAALCVNTLRTFNLIILALLGPIVLGISVFDGFQHILQVYFARYINIYLWLPIANILGAMLGTIQENMIKIDLSQLASNGETYFSTYDLGYIIFMIIGIVCFTTVPSIADMVLFVGGGNALQQKITNMTMSSSMNAMAATGGVMSTAGAILADTGSAVGDMATRGMAGSSAGNYYDQPPDNKGGYMHNKLSG